LRGRRWGFFGLAASCALLILSHLPITVAFSLVPILLAFFLIDSEKWRATFVTCGAMACGAGLVAIYLLPAMLDQSKVHLEHHLDPDFSYINWWLFSRAPLLDFKTRLLILTTSTLLFAAAMWWFSRRLPRRLSHRTETAFYGSVAVGSYVMMTQLT
jgi:MFS family permease